ncbi:hypothetical protein [Caulobacter sp. S45]|uniref:hypothetical protein n=1 Tax=Caulobacter sp. S45 TaxID=1641861 RepID=UPI00131B2A4A|nr:hypothetical protein [Caulobacter sp. S45]
MLTFLFALALAQAEPQGVAAAAAITPPVAEDGEVPKGAPAEDYDFVAWCHGALTGHMALYTLVKPELKSIERPEEVDGDEKADLEQMKAGREYLALYTSALRAAAKSHPKAMADRRDKAEAQGEAIWDAAKTAEPRSRMWSWLLWDLPGRCEVAAKRLETRSGILGAAFKSTAADVQAGDATAANASAAEAQPTKVESDAPKVAAPPAAVDGGPKDGAAPTPAPAEAPKNIDDALAPAAAAPVDPAKPAPPLRGPQ